MTIELTSIFEKREWGSDLKQGIKMKGSNTLHTIFLYIYVFSISGINTGDFLFSVLIQGRFG